MREKYLQIKRSNIYVSKEDVNRQEQKICTFLLFLQSKYLWQSLHILKLNSGLKSVPVCIFFLHSWSLTPFWKNSTEFQNLVGLVFLKISQSINSGGKRAADSLMTPWTKGEMTAPSAVILDDYLKDFSANLTGFILPGKKLTESLVHNFYFMLGRLWLPCDLFLFCSFVNDCYIPQFGLVCLLGSKRNGNFKSITSAYVR